MLFAPLGPFLKVIFALALLALLFGIYIGVMTQ